MSYAQKILIAVLLVAVGGGVNAQSLQDELDLPGIAAFSIGTSINIDSVREVSADSLNAELLAKLRMPDGMADSPGAIALLVVGGRMTGHHQLIEASGSPAEGTSDWFRVCVEDSGYENDSYNGQRWVIWLGREEDGRLGVLRALWAQLCERSYWTYYSSRPCP